jgi:hypothetical protein
MPARRQAGAKISLGNITEYGCSVRTDKSCRRNDTGCHYCVREAARYFQARGTRIPLPILNQRPHDLIRRALNFNEDCDATEGDGMRWKVKVQLRPSAMFFYPCYTLSIIAGVGLR